MFVCVCVLVPFRVQVLPVTFLPLSGYVAPAPGEFREQPDSCKAYILLLMGAASFAFCTLSAMFKLKFPLKTARQADAIGIGVALHKVNKPAPDPLSNENAMFELMQLHSKKEADQANLIDYFRGLKITRTMLGMKTSDAAMDETGAALLEDSAFEANKRAQAEALRKGYVRETVIYVILIIGFAAAVAGSVAAGLLDSDFDFVPTILMVLLGFSIVLTVKAAAQLAATKKFMENCSDFPVDLVRRMGTCRVWWPPFLHALVFVPVCVHR